MNERLTELYRASRPKEALASQDEFKSANALLGSDVDKFAELIVRETLKVTGATPSMTETANKHFGLE